jgi:hypothetical protein
VVSDTVRVCHCVDSEPRPTRELVRALVSQFVSKFFSGRSAAECSYIVICSVDIRVG